MDEDNDDDFSLGDHDFIPNQVDPIDLIMSDDFVPVDDDKIESLMEEEMSRSEQQLSEDSLDAAEGEKTEELSNDESFSLQQDIDESLEMTESEENETSSIQQDNIHPTENKTLFVQESIPNNESDTTEEDEIVQESIPNNESNTTEEDEIRKEDVEDYMNEKYGKRNHTFDLRPRRMRSYKHFFTQMGFKAGVKKFGSAGEEAVLNEFFQLNDYDCLEPRSDPMPDQKRIALEYLMTIKKKRDGKIKAIGCADGRKQRRYILKEEVSSPTVSYDSLILSCAIDAHER